MPGVHDCRRGRRSNPNQAQGVGAREESELVSKGDLGRHLRSLRVAGNASISWETYGSSGTWMGTGRGSLGSSARGS